VLSERERCEGGLDDGEDWHWMLVGSYGAC